MITYPLALPSSLKVRSLRISLDDAVAVSTSPYTFKQQAQSHQGQMWIFEVVVAPMKGEQAAACEAWITALRGRYGIFTIGDSARKTPRGTGGGTPQVNGGSQSGMYLVTDGWNHSELVLKAGDYIQFGCVNEFTGEFTGEFGGDPIARLHKVLEDVTTNSSGQATISIWPRLRSSPVDNAAITVTNCKGTFRLAENLRGWDIDEAKIYGFSFKAVEAL